MKSLAELVLEHRKSLDMNAAEYARHVGTSRQNINNVEADEARQPRYIGKLAAAMGASVDDLLAGRAGPWLVGGVQAPAASPSDHAIGPHHNDLARLAELLPALTPEQREGLMSIAEHMAMYGEAVKVAVTFDPLAGVPTRSLGRVE